jgi:outer membrane protein OmpA-like peptidoglycan-associated protein
MYALTFSDESTGLYNIQLRSGYDYRLVGESEGYQPLEMSLSLENKMTAYEYDLDLKLSKELMEASPALQEEIAGIQKSVEQPPQEKKVIVPSLHETQSEAKNIPQESVSENAPKPDNQSKSGKLASLSPITETETKTESKSDTQEVVKPEISAESKTENQAETKTGSQTPNQTANISSPNSITRTQAGRKTEVKTDNLIRFNFNSADLLPETSVILDAIAQFLQRHDIIKLEIGGFTDHIGDEWYNLELGKRRALTVKNHLINSGIAGSRIRIIGFGEKMPIVITTDIDQLQTNRRVEFNFTK